MKYDRKQEPGREGHPASKKSPNSTPAVILKDFHTLDTYGDY